MTQSPTCCSQRDSLQDAARLMLDKDCGVLPIVNSQDQVVGVVTDRDITCRAVATGQDLQGMVQEFMTSPVVTVRPDNSVMEAVRLMEDHRIRRLAVVDMDGCCCGMVSQADLARKVDEGLV